MAIERSSSIAKVSEFLESPVWTEGEKWVIKWQFGGLGDFQSALSEAIKRADDDNLRLLALGFPNQVAGFIAWNRGNLGLRLRDAGLEI